MLRFALVCPSLPLHTLLVSVIVVGCGPPSHPTDGAVAPRASTSRIEVSSGAMIELAYDLEIRPDAPRFDKNYRVLVGFLNAEGGVLWRDDHAPPVPSTRWLSGQTVSYSRRVFVPLAIPGGVVTVAMALQARNGERLILADEDLGSRQYRVASFEVNPIADARWIPEYESGFHGLEQNERGTWQWTTGEATLAYRNPGDGCVLYLTLGALPGRFEAPRAVTITVRGQVVDSFEIATRGQITRRVELSQSLVGTVNPLRVTIHVDQTFVPALAGGEDTRELGVRVFSATIDPETVRRRAAGLGHTERDEHGDLFQWSRRRALIFGPSEATHLELPLRRSPRLAQTVRVLLNGSFVDEVLLDDDAWRRVEYELLPPPDGIVRVELLVSPVTRVEGDPLPRGVMVGDYRWR